MKKLALFASGNGSNVEVLLSETKNGRLPVEWSVLICDNPNAPVVEKVKFYEVPCWSHQLSEFKDKKEFEKNIKKVLTFYNVDGIVLSGYMKIIGSEILNTWKGNIINLHPSLLPFFKGAHSIEDAFKSHKDVTGCSVHFVDEGIDTGTIIAERPVPIFSGDTQEKLTARIHEAEHILFPEIVKKIFCS